jgi:plastocyanin
MRRFPGLTAVFLIVALASCGGATGDRITGGGGGETNEIKVANNSYDPASITVARGKTVTWEWVAGSSNHSVTFDDSVTSATISSGSYSRTFDAAGVFPYHCKVHGLSMSGSVTVQ